MKFWLHLVQITNSVKTNFKILIQLKTNFKIRFNYVSHKLLNTFDKVKHSNTSTHISHRALSQIKIRIVIEIKRYNNPN